MTDTVPPPQGLLCFDTALGRCALVWSGAGILGSQLPEENARATRERMRQRFPLAQDKQMPPPFVQQAVLGVQRLLAGQTADHRELLAVPLDDQALPVFERCVLALTRQIPVGATRSYGELAAALGRPGAARAVGRAEGGNPFAPIVPCHRVLGAGGRGVGFSAHGGLQTKQRLLLIEARAAGQFGGPQQSLFD